MEQECLLDVIKLPSLTPQNVQDIGIDNLAQAIVIRACEDFVKGIHDERDAQKKYEELFTVGEKRFSFQGGGSDEEYQAWVSEMVDTYLDYLELRRRGADTKRELGKFFRGAWFMTLTRNRIDGEKVMWLLENDMPLKWMTKEEREEALKKLEELEHEKGNNSGVDNRSRNVPIGSSRSAET